MTIVQFTKYKRLLQRSQNMLKFDIPILAFEQSSPIAAGNWKLTILTDLGMKLFYYHKID